MNARINPDNLKRLIHSELDLASQLQALLQKENDVLSKRDFTELPDITQTKLRLVEQLETRTRDRNNWAQKLDAGNEKAWQSMVDHGDAELKESWNQLKQELDMCKRINRINELVVNRSLKATQRVLSIIRGGNVEQSLYGKQGNKLRARVVGSYLSV